MRFVVVILTCALGMVLATASRAEADITAFLGVTTSPGTRTTQGVGCRSHHRGIRIRVFAGRRRR